MNRYTTTLFLVLITNLSILSQNKYWIFLNDKNNVEYDYESYLDQKAVDRRIKIDYPLNDYTDLPINKVYVKDLNQYVISITGSSRWFNAVACHVEEENIPIIEYEIKYMDNYVPKENKLAFSRASSILGYCYYVVLLSCPDKSRPARISGHMGKIARIFAISPEYL